MSCSYASQNVAALSSSASANVCANASASVPVLASYPVSRRSANFNYQRSVSVIAQPFSSSSSAGAAAVAAYNSQIEQQVISARQPIQVQEREQIQAGPYRGIYLNKQEVEQFRGPIPVEQYKINEDPNPEVIRKRLDKLRYTQEVAVRYLQPPAAPRPGDLIIRERHAQIPPAPPVVLRQEACQAKTPEPLVYREQPPRRPAAIPPQTVEVEGAPIPPPARRVVLEKLSSLPAKPQNILIEKWLPYKAQKRRVVYQRSCAAPPPNPKNLVIEWEAPDVEVEKVCKNLGVVAADPEEYVRRFGAELKPASEIPNLCERPQLAPTPLPAPPAPCGCQQQQEALVAPEQPIVVSASAVYGAASALPELEGDVEALRRVDLEANGLGAYRRYIQ